VIGGLRDAALRDEHGVGGELGGELEGGLEPHFEGAQVAVVDADQSAAEVTDAARLVAGVDLAEDIEREFARAAGELRKLGIAERGGNQQNSVCAMRARLEELVLVEDEVLAQAGQGGGAG